MMWFLLNLPLAMVIFGAVCGIPLVKVLRDPSYSSAQAGGQRVRADGERRGQPQVAGLVLAGAHS